MNISINHLIIYEYLYICDVKFSLKQAQTEGQMMLAKLYNDQLGVFTQKGEDLLKSLSNGTITPENYESSSLIYDKLIEKSRASLKKLEPSS